MEWFDFHKMVFIAVLLRSVCYFVHTLYDEEEPLKYNESLSICISGYCGGLIWTPPPFLLCCSECIQQVTVMAQSVI